MKKMLMLAMVVALTVQAAPDRPSATPQDVFDSMREVFNAQKAAGIHARYQWDITGANGGHWFVEVNDGKLRMGRGKVENPNVTFVVSDRDWVAISNNQLSGVWAYVTGRLKVRGDQGIARKLDEMF